jgi:undecaprenyl diphosphate synthase
MHTRDCPPVDLVRTFGQQRLSDFLLWQNSHALLVMTCIADIVTCYMTCRWCTHATARQ